MAKQQGRVGIGIDFNVNTASLNKVRDSLKQLRSMSKDAIEGSGGKILDVDKGAIKSWKNNLGAMRKELDKLEDAFAAAYNPKLGTYELNKFNESLQRSGTTAAQAFSVVASYGAEGKSALLDMTQGMLAVERVGKQTNETFKKLGDTMINTLRWSVTSTALNTVTGAIQQAYHYAVDLDRALNDIMIVTDKSSSEMENFAKQANKAAKELGVSTKSYTEASLIYYQQGLGDKETKSRTETTMRVAAVTGQSAQQVSEQLTAVWNGYKVSAEESEKYIDKLSAVAASTATDLEELSIGMSKVASAANIMGVDVDQLNAQLATIVSVTREAPEAVGTALKTVYARMSDIEAGIDTETTLGEYTSQMAQMGINVLDANGKLRDMGAVVEEIGNKWSSLNREQQTSLAQSIAGTRQYSRMMALFDNWDMYQSAMTTSVESAGALTEQHVKYLNSIEAHQEKLRTSAEGLYDTIFDSEEIKGVYDLLSGLVEMADGFVKGLGGMPGILATIVMLMTTLGKQSIQDLLMKRQTNRLQQEMYKSQITNGKAAIKQLTDEIELEGELEKRYQNILDLEDRIYKNADNLTDEGWNNLQAGVDHYIETLKIAIDAEKKINTIQQEKTQIENELAGTGYQFNFSGEKGAARKENAQNRTKNLRKKLNQSDLSVEDKKATELELVRLEKNIKLGEKKLKVDEELAKAKDELTKKTKTVTDSLEQQNAALNENIDSIEKSSKFTDVIQGLSGVGFAAMTASGAVQSFFDATNESSGGLTDWIGAISGATMSLVGPHLSAIETGIKAYKKQKIALQGVGAGAQAAGAGFKAFLAAMGPIGWITLAVSVLSSLVTVFQELEQAKIDAANATIEEERERQKELKTNQELEQSYLSLYEAYKKTGDGKESMIDAADSVIEALESEELQALREAGAYELLAQRIREKMAAQQEDVIQSATVEKSAAESKLNLVKNSSVSGLGSGNYYTNASDNSGIAASIISLGDSKEDGELQNLDILAKTFEDSELLLGKDEKKIYFKSIAAMTSEEKVDFYNRLEEATGDEKWNNESYNEVNKYVRKVLADEDLNTAVSDYSTATKTLSKEKARETIQNKSYTSDTSLSTFAADRDALIATIMEEQGIDDKDAAAAQLKALYDETGGDAAKLSSRYLAVKGIIDANADKGLGYLEGLYDEAGLELADEIFSQISTLDLTKYGSIEEVINAAAERAQKALEAGWAALGEKRIKAIGFALNDLEEDYDKVFGPDKIKNLKEQTALLEKQKKIYEQTRDSANASFGTAKEDFVKLAKDYGWNFEAALETGDWEFVKNQILGIGQTDQDTSRALQTAFEKVIDASNAFKEAEDQVQEAEEQINETIQQRFEALQESFEYERNSLQQVNSLYEKQIQLANMLKDSKTELFLKSELVDNLQASYEQTAAMAAQSREVYLDSIANGEDWRDTSKKAETYFSAIEAHYENLISWAEQAKEVFGFEVEKWLNDAAGITDMQLAQERQALLDQRSEQFLDDIDKAHRLSQLESRFNKEIANATSASARKALVDLRDRELEALEKMDELSENDLQRTEKLFELEKARIALQEAQQNKTQMKLVRGADGTYRYSYIADQNAISDAEQQVADLENELVNRDEDAWKNNLDSFYEDFAAFIEKVQELAEGGFSDGEKALLDSLYDTLVSGAGRNADLMSNLAASSGLSMDQLAAAFGVDSELLAGLSNFNTANKDAFFSALTQSYSNYEEVLNEIGKQLGVGSLIQTATQDALKQSEWYGKKREETSNELGTSSSASSQDTSSSNVTPEAQQGGDTGPITLWQGDVAGGKLRSGTEGHRYIDSDDWYQPVTLKEGEGDTNLINSDGDKFSGVGAKLYLHGATWEERVAKDESGNAYVAVHPYDDSSRWWWARVDALKKYKDPTVSPFNYYNLGAAFDTGGYTGAWGDSSGRMAMLHEKELVLNKQDTANFLEGIDILRDLNLSMLGTISSMGAGALSSTAAWELAQDMIIEQTVNISADFPNATDRDEIKAAFDDLINLATQHAYINNTK